MNPGGAADPPREKRRFRDKRKRLFECGRRQGSQLLDQGHDLHVPGEIPALEPGVMAAVIVGRQVFERLDLPRQEVAAERAVRNESNAQLAEVTGGTVKTIDCSIKQL